MVLMTMATMILPAHAMFRPTPNELTMDRMPPALPMPLIPPSLWPFCLGDFGALTTGINIWMLCEAGLVPTLSLETINDIAISPPLYAWETTTYLVDGLHLASAMGKPLVSLLQFVESGTNMDWLELGGICLELESLTLTEKPTGQTSDLGRRVLGMNSVIRLSVSLAPGFWERSPIGQILNLQASTNLNYGWTRAKIMTITGLPGTAPYPLHGLFLSIALLAASLTTATGIATAIVLPDDRATATTMLYEFFKTRARTCPWPARFRGPEVTTGPAMTFTNPVHSYEAARSRMLLVRLHHLWYIKNKALFNRDFNGAIRTIENREAEAAMNEPADPPVPAAATTPAAAPAANAPPAQFTAFFKGAKGVGKGTPAQRPTPYPVAGQTIPQPKAAPTTIRNADPDLDPEDYEDLTVQESQED